MYTAMQKSREFEGFTWFEIFKNGKPTGNSYNAIDEKHAIQLHKLLN